MYFSNTYITGAKELIRRTFPQIRDRKIILYAPTFRQSPSKAEAPQMPDLAFLFERLSTKAFLLIRQHPFVKDKPDIPEQYRGSFCVDVSDDFRIETLLMGCDLCITDYSSLVFEYSLMEKPLLFYAYDYEEYNDWRGFYYPYESMTPGPVVKTVKDLAEQIEDAFRSFDPKYIREFRERFMQSCDGHSTDRILQWMEDRISTDS